MKKTIQLVGALCALLILLIVLLAVFHYRIDSTGNIFSKFKGHESQVVIPDYVPPGFKPFFATSTTVTYKLGPNYDRVIRHYEYTAEYCNEKGQCFRVENACEGMGSLLGGDEEATGTSKLYGDFTIELLRPGDEGNGGDTDYLISSWLRNKLQIENDEKAGIDMCADSKADSYHLLGRGLSLSEAVKIVESFDTMK